MSIIKAQKNYKFIFSYLKMAPEKKFISIRLCDIFKEVSQKYSSADNLYEIKLTQSIPVIINEDLMYTINCKTKEEIIVQTPYDYCNSTKNHVFCNHANVKLGGGMYSFGFVQEEQMLLRTTIMFPLYDLYFNDPDPRDPLNSDLNIQHLLIKTNVYAYQNHNMGLYSGDGLRQINNNSHLLNDFYKPHNSVPSVYILSKAIPKLENNDDYTNKFFNQLCIVDWIFYSAYHSYLLTIISLVDNNETKEICIHEGNWGCGVYNHNLNTIFTIVHLAFRAVCSLFQDANIKFVYHTYDTDSFNKLSPAINFLDEHIDAPIKVCIDKLKDYHRSSNSDWSVKL